MARTSASLLYGRQVVMLASIDWNSTWQRHQAFAQGFAQAGAHVFFVENTGFRNPGMRDMIRVLRRLGRWAYRGGNGPVDCKIVAPILLPPTCSFYRLANRACFAPILNRRLRRLGLKNRPIVFAYLPTSTTLTLLDLLEPALIVYDCVDNFAGHPSPPKDLEQSETELLQRADLVLTTSHTLYRAKSSRHPRVLELHHGVSPDFFQKGSSPLRHYQKLCYFGTLWSAVDYAPLKALAEAGFEVTLIGPVKEKPPELPPQVRFKGPLTHQDLAKALPAFDALLLPYVDSPYNQGVIPAKIYECLATGKPVLASPLPSLQPLRHLLYIAGSPLDFVHIARNLPKTESGEKIQARIAQARNCSTEKQMHALEQALSPFLL